MFDLIYIDADHSYPAVCNDIDHAVPKLRPEGLLAFNDFARIADGQVLRVDWLA